MTLNIPLSVRYMRFMRIGDAVVTTTGNEQTSTTFYARGMACATYLTRVIIEDTLVKVTIATFTGVHDPVKYARFLSPQKKGRKLGSKNKAQPQNGGIHEHASEL